MERSECNDQANDLNKQSNVSGELIFVDQKHWYAFELGAADQICEFPFRNVLFLLCFFGLRWAWLIYARGFPFAGRTTIESEARKKKKKGWSEKERKKGHKKKANEGRRQEGNLGVNKKDIYICLRFYEKIFALGHVVQVVLLKSRHQTRLISDQKI